MVLKSFIHLFLLIFIIYIIVKIFIYIEKKALFRPLKIKQDIYVEDEVYFYTENKVKLYGIWKKQKDQKAFTIFLFHGKSGNITTRKEYIEKLYRNNFNVFSFDYSGYGKSEGSANCITMIEDSVAAYQFLLSKIGVRDNKIIFFGRSLGCFCALKLGTKLSCFCVILEGCFTTFKDIRFYKFPFFKFLPTSIPIDNIDLLSKITKPILFLHGQNDKTVPITMSEKLFTQSPYGSKLVKFENCEHLDIYKFQEKKYFDEIKEFIYKSVE